MSSRCGTGSSITQCVSTEDNLAGLTFVSVSTLLWLNLSPFYVKREKAQHAMLRLLYERVGPMVNSLNDVLPRFWTSLSIDKRIRRLYYQRNSFLTGYVTAPEDDIAPLKPFTKYDKYTRKIIK